MPTSWITLERSIGQHLALARGAVASTVRLFVRQQFERYKWFTEADSRLYDMWAELSCKALMRSLALPQWLCGN